MVTKIPNVSPDLPGIAQSLGRVEGTVGGICIEVRDIKQTNEHQYKYMEETRKRVEGVEKKLDSHLEYHETKKAVEKEVEEAFYKKHPVKTVLIGGGGAVTVLGTIAGIIVYVIIKLNEAGLL